VHREKLKRIVSVAQQRKPGRGRRLLSYPTSMTRANALRAQDRIKFEMFNLSSSVTPAFDLFGRIAQSVPSSQRTSAEVIGEDEEDVGFLEQYV
jgi:hypothetical protein